MINHFFSPTTVTRNVNFFQPSSKFLPSILGQSQQHDPIGDIQISSRWVIDESASLLGDIQMSSRWVIDESASLLSDIQMSSRWVIDESVLQ